MSLIPAWFLLFFESLVLAQSYSIQLSWDSITNRPVSHYSVYQGGQSRVYTNVSMVGTNFNVATNLMPGIPYYFAVTDTDTNNLESAYSEELAVIKPQPDSASIVMSFTVPSTSAYVVQSSTDLVQWTDISPRMTPIQEGPSWVIKIFLFIDRTVPSMFYRAKNE